MNEIKLTAQETKEACWGDSEKYELIDEGEWLQDGKYQRCSFILGYEGKCYSLSTHRSGSPFTDWYYEWEDASEFTAYEVEQKEITITKWVLK